MYVVPISPIGVPFLYHAIDSNEFGADAKTSSFYTKLKAVKDKYPKP